jgi:hypothetical protein
LGSNQNKDLQGISYSGGIQSSANSSLKKFINISAQAQNSIASRNNSINAI